MKAVAVRGLNLYYGRRQILREVELTVAVGEFLMIIGPNGTGKTSLLKAVAGLVKAGGEIAILEQPLAGYHRQSLARELAVVPQLTTTDFPFTVAETVLMGRSPHLGLLELEGPEDHRLARQAMEFTEVAELADRRLDELSGGERQRVIIARAICQQPRIILLDEPTASLDPAHQVRIMDLLEQLRREQGMTVIMVSHDLNLAAMYGGRLALMSGGRITAVGTPAEVLTVDRLEACYGCRMEVVRSSPAAPLRVHPLSAVQSG
ncbi:MAG TPA: ABC transporter ATP-binding protein [Desulfurivibrionaceae bacterium]|nr:ABC transporter ATP-binding protein [Desulfurivibrionaceae bacterium]